MDASSKEEPGSILESIGWPERERNRRHDVADPVIVESCIRLRGLTLTTDLQQTLDFGLFNVVLCLFSRYPHIHLEPPAHVLRAFRRESKHVGGGDDTDEFALRVQHRDAADRVLEQNVDQFADRHLRDDPDHLLLHRIAHPPGTRTHFLPGWHEYPLRCRATAPSAVLVWAPRLCPEENLARSGVASGRGLTIKSVGISSSPRFR